MMSTLTPFTTSGSRRLVPGALVAALVAMLLAVLASPALADPAVQDTVEVEFTELVDDFCGQDGLAVRHDYVENSTVTGVNEGRHGYVHFRFRLHVRETWTNVDTGQTLALSMDGVIQDTAVTDNGDGTLSKSTNFASVARWKDQDGKLVALDSGLTGLEIVNDHNGTPLDPSDDQTIDVRVIRESNGRNEPVFDQCDIIVPVIG